MPRTAPGNWAGPRLASVGPVLLARGPAIAACPDDSTRAGSIAQAPGRKPPAAGLRWLTRSRPEILVVAPIRSRGRPGRSVN
jgi:hypothetical protein